MDPASLPPAHADRPVPGRRDVQIWYLRIDGPRLPAVRDRLAIWLSPDEQARHDRLRIASARDQFLTAHAMVRAVLARARGTQPARVQFTCSEHGRPELTDASIEPRLRFNLSHTDGMVVLGVVLDRDIGVDVESSRRVTHSLDLAQRFFAPGEAAALKALPPDERQSAFFDYWTLKEAYVKAIGLGLTHPLGTFAMHIDRRGDQTRRTRESARGEIRIAFAEDARDHPAAWQFALTCLDATHHVAVAVRRAPDEFLRTHWIPLTLDTLTGWFHE